MAHQRTTIAIFSDATCERTMVTLIETLRTNHDWAIDRIHFLCEQNEEHEYQNAYAIQKEFSEWLDPNIEDHDIFSLEYIGEEDDTRSS